MKINSLKRDLCMMVKKEREITDKKTSIEKEKVWEKKKDQIDSIDQKDQKGEIDKIDSIDHQISKTDLKELNDNKEEISTWIKADKTDLKIDSLTTTETTEEETMISKMMRESEIEINQEVSSKTGNPTMKTGTIDNLEKETSEEMTNKSSIQGSEDSARTTDPNHLMGKGDKTRFPSSIHRWKIREVIRIISCHHLTGLKIELKVKNCPETLSFRNHKIKSLLTSKSQGSISLVSNNWRSLISWRKCPRSWRLNSPQSRMSVIEWAKNNKAKKRQAKERAEELRELD